MKQRPTKEQIEKSRLKQRCFGYHRYSGDQIDNVVVPKETTQTISEADRFNRDVAGVYKREQQQKRLKKRVQIEARRNENMARTTHFNQINAGMADMETQKFAQLSSMPNTKAKPNYSSVPYNTVNLHYYDN